MPVDTNFELKPGDYYEDCSYHPCLCVKVSGFDIAGISLVDGSYPRSCDIEHCGVRKLTPEEAMEWRFYGPRDIPAEQVKRWWPAPGAIEHLCKKSND